MQPHSQKTKINGTARHYKLLLGLVGLAVIFLLVMMQIGRQKPTVTASTSTPVAMLNPTTTESPIVVPPTVSPTEPATMTTFISMTIDYQQSRVMSISSPLEQPAITLASPTVWLKAPIEGGFMVWGVRDQTIVVAEQARFVMEGPGNYPLLVQKMDDQWILKNPLDQTSMRIFDSTVPLNKCVSADHRPAVACSADDATLALLDLSTSSSQILHPEASQLIPEKPVLTQWTERGVFGWVPDQAKSDLMRIWQVDPESSAPLYQVIAQNDYDQFTVVKNQLFYYPYRKFTLTQYDLDSQIGQPMPASFMKGRRGFTLSPNQQKLAYIDSLQGGTFAYLKENVIIRDLTTQTEHTFRSKDLIDGSFRWSDDIEQVLWLTGGTYYDIRADRLWMFNPRLNRQVAINLPSSTVHARFAPDGTLMLAYMLDNQLNLALIKDGTIQNNQLTSDPAFADAEIISLSRQ